MAGTLIPHNERDNLELNENARRIVQHLVSASPDKKIVINLDEYNLMAVLDSVAGAQFIWEYNEERNEYSVYVEYNTYKVPYPDENLLYKIVQDEEPVAEPETA